MNTTEHLVEAYFRQQGCFTASDVKIEKGNNRQFDLLAYNIVTKKSFHIEVSVAHGERWPVTLDGIKEKVKYKFFGTTKNLRPNNPRTDFARGKVYLDQIKEAYSKFGIEYEKVIRVWCVWSLKPPADIDRWKQSLAKEFGLKPTNFEILLFRDIVLPSLLDSVGTAFYDDQLLRTISLIKEYNKQKVIIT